jgi:hypothetical protein
MVKTSEPLINAVTSNKPKRLRVPKRKHRLGPKGERSSIGAVNSPIADDAPPAKRRNLSHLNQVFARNVVSQSVSLWESEPQGTPMGWLVEDAGESKSPLVMKGIEIAPLEGYIISRESGQTSSRCLFTR